MYRFNLAFLFISIIITPLHAQKRKVLHPQKPLVVLNTNRTLNAAKARRALFLKEKLNPLQLDSIAVKHRLRFVELYAERSLVGQLGHEIFTALYDLSNDNFVSHKSMRLVSTEKDPQLIRKKLLLIKQILTKEKIFDLALPVRVSHVSGSSLGLYFDIDFTLRDTLIRAHVDYRYNNKKSRIIVYDDQ